MAVECECIKWPRGSPRGFLPGESEEIPFRALFRRYLYHVICSPRTNKMEKTLKYHTQWPPRLSQFGKHYVRWIEPYKHACICFTNFISIFISRTEIRNNNGQARRDAHFPLCPGAEAFCSSLKPVSRSFINVFNFFPPS